MNVLVVFEGIASKPLADAIAQGARELQSQVTLKSTVEKPATAGFDFVFIGGILDGRFTAQSFIEKSDFGKAKAALFCVKKGTGTLDLAIQTLQQKGVSVERNSFTAQLQGALAFAGMGSLKEADLIRARGFGERTLNIAFGLDIAKDTEKADRIRGYLK